MSILSPSSTIRRISSLVNTPPGSRVVTISYSLANLFAYFLITEVFPAPSGPSNVINVDISYSSLTNIFMI